MTRVLMFKGAISQYDVLFRCTDDLQKAFAALGCACHVVDLAPENAGRSREYQEALRDFQPDLVFSFQGWGLGFGAVNGTDVFTVRGTPFFAFLGDDPVFHAKRIPLLKSSMVFKCWPVKSWAAYADRLGMGDNLFMPWGGSPRDVWDRRDRPVDILLSGSIADPEAIRAGWRDRFSPAVVRLMEETAEVWQKDLLQPMDRVFGRVLRARGVDLTDDARRQLEFTLLPHINLFVRNRLRLQVVRALKDLPLTICGNGPWRDLAGGERFDVRPALSFPVVEEIMARSKVVLNVLPSVFDGMTERAVTAFFNGAVVATNENLFMNQAFNRGKDFVSFDFNDLEDLKESLVYYLSNRAARDEMAERAWTAARQGHTWEHRARQVLDAVRPMIESPRSSRRPAGFETTNPAASGAPSGVRVLLIRAYSQYNVLRYFVDSFHEAFAELGCDCRILDLCPRNAGELVEAVRRFEPDFIFAANAHGLGWLRPADRALIAARGIPFLAFMVDPPVYFPRELLEWMGTGPVLPLWGDAVFLPHAREMGARNSLFLPVGGRDVPDASERRGIDILLAGSMKDPEKIRSGWEERFGKRVARVMAESAEAWEQDLFQPLFAVFRRMLADGGVDPSEVDPRTENAMLFEINEYVRYRLRLAVARAVRDLPVTVFATGPWRELVGDSRWDLRGPIPFPLLQRQVANSKIVLNVAPLAVDGVSERVFTAMFSRAALCTNENRFLDARFERNRAFVSYRFDQLDDLKDRLEFLLTNAAEREEMAERAQASARRGHTWIHRAREVLAVVERRKAGAGSEVSA